MYMTMWYNVYGISLIFFKFTSLVTWSVNSAHSNQLYQGARYIPTRLKNSCFRKKGCLATVKIFLIVMMTDKPQTRGVRKLTRQITQRCEYLQIHSQKWKEFKCMMIRFKTENISNFNYCNNEVHVLHDFNNILTI